MRRVLLIPAVVLALAALLPAGALAQAPDFRDRFVESGTDPDFCGTGVEVNFVDDIVGQGWETDTTFRLTFRGRTTLSSTSRIPSSCAKAACGRGRASRGRVS